MASESHIDLLISWSGRQSRFAADALYAWLPKVLPDIKPWMSSQDIDKGSRWANEIQGYLQSAKACIVCLTPENIRSPWLYWETGAIGLAQQYPVCPLLFGISPEDIRESPLSLYQCTFNRKDDIWNLVRSLNRSCNKTEDDMRLRGIFESHWTEVQSAFANVQAFGMPDNVRVLLTGLQSLKRQFQTRWTIDNQSESWDAIKQLVGDTSSKILRLLTEAKVDSRLEIHCKVLHVAVKGIVGPATRSGAQDRMETVLPMFDRTFSAILTHFDMSVE